MKFQIRLARETDLPDYTKFLQKTYQETYINARLGLTSACFSETVFNAPGTQKYLLSNLQVNSNQKAWVVHIGVRLIGSVSIIEREDDYELRGFYVATDYQNKGIGKELWRRVLKFVKGKDITCDVYFHNTKTIEMYKKWGFEIDKGKKEFYRHWLEWPEQVKAKSIYMRYKLV